MLVCLCLAEHSVNHSLSNAPAQCSLQILKGMKNHFSTNMQACLQLVWPARPPSKRPVSVEGKGRPLPSTPTGRLRDGLAGQTSLQPMGMKLSGKPHCQERLALKVNFQGSKVRSLIFRAHSSGTSFITVTAISGASAPPSSAGKTCSVASSSAESK